MNTMNLCTVNWWDFFGPKWHSLRPKKSRFSGPNPYNGPCNGYCPPQNHYVPRHKNNMHINIYFFLKSTDDYYSMGGKKTLFFLSKMRERREYGTNLSMGGLHCFFL